jgi:hypothetical protein
VRAARAPMGPDWVYEISMTATDSWFERPTMPCASTRGVARIGRSAFPGSSKPCESSKQHRCYSTVKVSCTTARACRISRCYIRTNTTRRCRCAPSTCLNWQEPQARKQPLLERKELLTDLLAKVKDAIEFNDHIEDVAGHAVFDHACKLGHEGIVVKRKDLPYESGRSKRWVKVKNPDSRAMKR